VEVELERVILITGKLLILLGDRMDRMAIWIISVQIGTRTKGHEWGQNSRS
jgi:hypothetical protein